MNRRRDFELRKRLTFEAAHRLTQLPSGHPCHRLHGHRYELMLALRGPLDEARGWIIDTADIKRAFQPIYEQLDHHYLNEIPGLENPTVEILARWIYDRAKPLLPFLHQVTIAETATTEAVYPVQCSPVQCSPVQCSPVQCELVNANRVEGDLP